MPTSFSNLTSGDYDPWAQTQETEEKSAQQKNLTVNDVDTDAQRQADNAAYVKNRLRLANRDAQVIDVELLGDPSVRAGLVVQSMNWGVADGNYLIDGTSHHVTARGYTCTLKAHKALVGY